MHWIRIVGVLLLISVLAACRTDFNFTPTIAPLAFSEDTVYLDTVFSHTGSSTYRFKVYNRSKDNISIPSIQLANGTGSKFRLMVDGLTGKDENNDGIGDGKRFEQVELLAEDSLFVMVEVTADIQDANPQTMLYTDEVLFQAPGQTQKVNLVTLVQDAYFIYPKRLTATTYEGISLGLDDAGQNKTFYGCPLDENDPVNGNELHWRNDKPYVIYGYAQVPDGKTLTVDPGARVHFHANSGLVVSKNGHIKVQGGPPPAHDPDRLDNEVIFEGDRLEPEFANVPGQWGTVMLLSQANDNVLEHLTIRNATVGLLVQNYATLTDPGYAKVSLRNVQMYNHSNVGILARKAMVTGKNLAIGDAGQASIACSMGGQYSFEHCTLYNTWPGSKPVALSLDNYFLNADNSITPFDLTQASFVNCILYSSNSKAIGISKTDQAAFATNFENNLIRYQTFSSTLPAEFQFLADNNPFGNLTNQSPKFVGHKNHPFQLDTGSAALGQGQVITPTYNDLLDFARPSAPQRPDIGAYQKQP